MKKLQFCLCISQVLGVSARFLLLPLPIPEKGFVAIFHRCAATLINHPHFPSCSSWWEWEERERGCNGWTKLLRNCTFLHIPKEEKIIWIKAVCVFWHYQGTWKIKPSTWHKLLGSLKTRTKLWSAINISHNCSPNFSAPKMDMKNLLTIKGSEIICI